MVWRQCLLVTTILPVLLLLCLSRKSHLNQLFAEEAEGGGCIYSIARLCVLEAFLLVLPGKMYTCHTAAEASHQSMLMDHKKVVLLLQCCLIGSL